jgi:cytoskeletal protein CcmA (bactofilin family)
MSDKNSLPTGKHTLVEEGTEFKGTMSSKCPIVVMGKVEGEVTGPEIHVTASGVMAGHVKVKQLRSAGELAGEIEADSVQISGKVRDKTVIRARSLEVALTSAKGGMEVLFGECELAIGDEPNKDAAIAAALASPAVAVVAAVATVAAEPVKEEVKEVKEDKKEESKKDGKDGHRRRGQSESWDASAGDPLKTEPTAAATTTPEDEAAGKRRRGTLPPPH